jgi:ferric-dicitrate binding protein FerR (iron transport regulator)
MTVGERAAYERWLSDDANRRDLDEMQRIWAMLEITHRPASPAVSYWRESRSMRKIMIAATCLVSLSVMVLSLASTSFWTTLDWVNR